MGEAFVSGSFGSGTRSDCRISYIPKKNGGLHIELESRQKALYGEQTFELAGKALGDLGIANGLVKIEDGGAMPFVLAARIEAAVKTAHPELKKQSLPEMKQHSTYQSRRDRFRRSRLYLPGSQPKLMLNAGIHKPDGVILDLEDSVAPSEKLSARLIVRNALRVLDFFGAERMVRINQGDLGIEDLEAIAAQNVHLVLLPKIESAGEVIRAEEKIKGVCEKAGREDPVFLMPIIESAKGVLKALEIAQASPNIVALTIGLEDYTADIGAARTLEGKESFFARSMIINAARASGVQAIDTVYSDVADTEGLISSVLEAKGMGFDGKGCIHPRQIEIIHDAFAPTEIEINRARKIVIAFKEAEEKGLGVVSLGTKMIDPPVVKRAQRTIQLAVASGRLEENWKNAT